MRIDNDALTPGMVVAGPNISGMSALLDELFDNPQRDPITTRNVFPGTFIIIVGTEDSFTQIQ